jgi:hypothetical protein
LGLVQSIARENIWKEREAQNDAIQWGADVDSTTSSEEGWPGVPADAVMFHKCLTPKSVTIRSYKQQK